MTAAEASLMFNRSLFFVTLGQEKLWKDVVLQRL